jgi:diguanylate cyclase (GGDEF)-like protein/PAS domain S-box-containing protein
MSESMQRAGSRRGAVVIAVMLAALVAAIAWATWEGHRADLYQAAATGVGAPGLSGRIALALLLAMAASLAGAALARWARLLEATPEETPGSGKDQAILQAMLAGTTEAVILADPQGRIRNMNPAAEILFGCLGEDLAGTKLTGLFPRLYDEPDGTAAMAQLAGTGDPEMAPALHETEAERSDGKTFPVRLWVRGLPLDTERYVLITAHDTTEQDQQSRELAHRRSRDQLTGLLNRQELQTRLAAIVAGKDPASAERPWVLCQLDVDQFTLINSTCGPAAGDKLLQQLARLIETKLAGAELVARLGGDEFAVLLRDADVDAAVDICEGLMQTVRGFLFTWQDRSFDMAISVGIVAWDARAQSPDDILGRSETACHLAKRGGRNRIHVYREDEAALVHLRDEMHLVSTITRALSDGAFQLLAQPIVPISGDPPTGCHFEILVRMVDRTGALVAPSQFIPAAEHYILMPSVDRWIISRLFALQAENLRAWNRTNPNEFLFAINLSGTTVTDDGFLRYLKRHFEDWQVPYRSICFEITETAAVGSLEQASHFIREFSALGCHFALDDFGTGLSSYAYLRALGVHYLKIDGTFVRGVAEDEINRAVVESINHIGHALGLKTIAEWVEDDRTLEALRALGVDYAQGFAVGPAFPVAEFTLTHPAMSRRFCVREP